MITEAQKKMIKKVSEWHETKVWTVLLNKNIRICSFNKAKKEFAFLTIMPNGASIGKEHEREPADEMLMNIWRQLPSEVK
jgi:hypothetical protein